MNISFPDNHSSSSKQLSALAAEDSDINTIPMVLGLVKLNYQLYLEKRPPPISTLK